MQSQSFAGPNSPVSMELLPTSVRSATLESIVIVLASHFKPPPDMSAYHLNLIKIFS